ncbi:hypothetical protein ACLOJK_029531 [Asimina triloba]
MPGCRLFSRLCDYRCRGAISSTLLVFVPIGESLPSLPTGRTHLSSTLLTFVPISKSLPSPLTGRTHLSSALPVSVPVDLVTTVSSVLPMRRTHLPAPLLLFVPNFSASLPKSLRLFTRPNLYASLP